MRRINFDDDDVDDGGEIRGGRLKKQLLVASPERLDFTAHGAELLGRIAIVSGACAFSAAAFASAAAVASRAAARSAEDGSTRTRNGLPLQCSPSQKTC